jgi:hypothetical protein
VKELKKFKYKKNDSNEKKKIQKNVHWKTKKIKFSWFKGKKLKGKKNKKVPTEWNYPIKFSLIGTVLAMISECTHDPDSQSNN